MSHVDAKERFRAQYRAWFDDGEIGDLALESGWGNANGGTCPTQMYRAAQSGPDDYLAACGAATCPVCNFCFKYCHPEDRHGNESDVY